MEFETNEAANQPQYDTAARLEAANRRLTVTPLHSEISADDLPDEQVAARHVSAPAIANAPIDLEVTAPAPAVPIASTESVLVAPRKPLRAVWVSVSAAITLLLIGALIFVVLQRL